MPNSGAANMLPMGSKIHNGSTTTVQQIFDRLRRRILTLELKPGQKLVNKQLMSEFGVSQTPIREAILRLESAGLVDVVPQSATRVSLINVQSARESHFLRLSVEIEIARRLATSVTATDIVDLRAMIEKQAIYAAEADFSKFVLADNAFHRHMYSLGGVSGLWDIVRSQIGHLDRMRALHIPRAGLTARILKDHTAITDALATGDSAAAEAATRQHLKYTVSADEDMRNFPDFFAPVPN